MIISTHNIFVLAMEKYNLAVSLIKHPLPFPTKRGRQTIRIISFLGLWSRRPANCKKKKEMFY